MTRKDIKENPDQRKEYARAYYQKNKKRGKGYRLKSRYGLTQEQWASLFAAQDNACAICRRATSTPHWCTDHDHATEKVRGILCICCNLSLGYMKDNPVALRLAAEYLERHTTV